MNWLGTWQNQYGSTLTIIDDANGRIAGTFETALLDSGFYGQEIGITGIHLGNCIGFTFATSDAYGDLLCSFSGLLRDGRIETVWHIVSDSCVDAGGHVEERRWPHAVMTNADTFSRAQ